MQRLAAAFELRNKLVAIKQLPPNLQTALHTVTKDLVKMQIQLRNKCMSRKASPADKANLQLLYSKNLGEALIKLDMAEGKDYVESKPTAEQALIKTLLIGTHDLHVVQTIVDKCTSIKKLLNSLEKVCLNPSLSSLENPTLYYLRAKKKFDEFFIERTLVNQERFLEYVFKNVLVQMGLLYLAAKDTEKFPEFNALYDSVDPQLIYSAMQQLKTGNYLFFTSPKYLPCVFIEDYFQKPKAHCGIAS